MHTVYWLARRGDHHWVRRQQFEPDVAVVARPRPARRPPRPTARSRSRWMASANPRRRLAPWVFEDVDPGDRRDRQRTRDDRELRPDTDRRRHGYLPARSAERRERADPDRQPGRRLAGRGRHRERDHQHHVDDVDVGDGDVFVLARPGQRLWRDRHEDHHGGARSTSRSSGGAPAPPPTPSGGWRFQRSSTAWRGPARRRDARP